jgi:hypothetical protein
MGDACEHRLVGAREGLREGDVVYARGLLHF